MTSGDFYTLSGTHIQVLAPIQELQYFDTQSVLLAKTVTPIDAWNIIMSRPMPILKLAFCIRDEISSRFGVKRIGGFTGSQPKVAKVGEKLDFFFVEYASQEVLTLTERDRHLDVMTCISTRANELTITSSVKTHNAFGRAYMLPVGQAHKLIVRKMLKRLHAATSATR